jgi:hypothetical protein
MDLHPAGYWTTNLYREKAEVPGPEAPCRDLREGDARRFQKLRTALLDLAGVQERVVYLGGAWTWVWEYSAEGRHLIYVHPMRGSVSATLTVAPEEEAALTANGNVGPRVRAALAGGVLAGPVRWCWLDLPADGDVEEVIAAMRYRRTLSGNGH